MNTSVYLKVKKLILEADAVLIGAGSGLSSSAGIDYSEETFRKTFPEFVKRYHMKDMYTSAFYPFSTEEEKWGYWAHHIDYSFMGEALECYRDLYELIKDKNYFVITTNVDGQFLKSHFDSDRVFPIQGSYGEMQCAIGCHKKIYDNTNLVKEMLKHEKDLKVPSSFVPTCPVCKGPMEIHIRKDAFFIEEETWEKSKEAYQTFLNNNRDKKLLLLELGVGFNTPGIIRYPFEEIAYQFRNVLLVRVNDTYPEVPEELGNEAYSFQEDCASFIKHVLHS